MSSFLQHYRQEYVSEHSLCSKGSSAVHWYQVTPCCSNRNSTVHWHHQLSYCLCSNRNSTVHWYQVTPWCSNRNSTVHWYQVTPWCSNRNSSVHWYQVTPWCSNRNSTVHWYQVTPWCSNRNSTVHWYQVTPWGSNRNSTVHWYQVTPKGSNRNSTVNWYQVTPWGSNRNSTVHWYEVTPWGSNRNSAVHWYQVTPRGSKGSSWLTVLYIRQKTPPLLLKGCSTFLGFPTPLSVSHISNDYHMKKEHINLYSLRQAFLYLTVTRVRGSGDFLHGTALVYTFLTSQWLCWLSSRAYCFCSVMLIIKLCCPAVHFLLIEFMQHHHQTVLSSCTFPADWIHSTSSSNCAVQLYISCWLNSFNITCTVVSYPDLILLSILSVPCCTPFLYYLLSCTART